MGIPKEPQKGLLFCAILYNDEDVFSLALNHLQHSFGETALYSPPLKWDFSNYYKEIGSQLKRRYCFFERPVALDQLADIKIAANEIEALLSVHDMEGSKCRRTINIDPGYMTPAKVVLASTKDYSHRIYLGKGIFAEVTLIYRNNQYEPHINTYRDYRTREHQFYFHLARTLLRQFTQLDTNPE